MSVFHTVDTFLCGNLLADCEYLHVLRISSLLPVLVVHISFTLAEKLMIVQKFTILLFQLAYCKIFCMVNMIIFLKTGIQVDYMF